MKKAILLVALLCLSVYHNLQAQNVGDIRIFAGTYVPAGWKSCEGQLLQISQNQALYDVLGTTYGGDGKTTFALPDLRDRSASGGGAYAQNAPATVSTIQLGEKKEIKTEGINTGEHRLGLIYIIAVTVDPEDSPMFGEVRAFAGSFAPRDWMSCEGQLLQISQNQVLYDVLGTTYGGDGKTTFALPDLRDRPVVGVSLENTAGMTNPIKLGEKREIKSVFKPIPVPYKLGLTFMIAIDGAYPMRK